MICEKTDHEIIREMGDRLRAYRLRANISQEALAVKAGLNRNTVANAEAGEDPRLSTLLRVLRVLGKLEAVDDLLPPPGVSPLQLLKMQGKTRQRARQSRGKRF